MLDLFLSPTRAQDSQFLFDGNGNLLAQTAAAIGLPQILSQPQNQVVAPGSPASFSVVVADTRGLIYQWRRNGADIGGANVDALLLTNVSTNDEAQYSVVLSKSSGSVTSAPAMLWLDSDEDGLPDSWEMTYFGNLTNNAAGDHDGDGISNDQELHDGTDPADPASVRYRLTVLSDGGSVSVVPNQLSYTNGESVTLTASPADAFHAWTGDILTRSNIIMLTISTNRTVFARFTPIDFVWTGPSGDDWNVAANWTPNFVPGSNDNALVIGTHAVTVNSDTDCGGLILGSSSASPTLTGSGTLTLHGASIWNNGNMTGSGRTLIAAGATLNINNDSAANLTSRTLENAGTTTCTGIADFTGSGGVITNRAGALFEVQNNASFSYTLLGCRFDNAGTFRKRIATGTTTFSGFTFNNYGTVDLQSGMLLCGSSLVNNGTVTLSAGTTNRLTGGGSASGSFIASANALVEFGAGAFTLNAGAQLNGTGLYKVSGSGSLTANTDVSPQNLDLAATLGGTGIVTVNNAMNWTSGTMTGSGRTLIAAGATLNISNASEVNLSTRTLENAGTTTFTGTADFSGSGSVITNRLGALFEVQNNASFLNTLLGCRFDNAGTFRKRIATGTNTFSGFTFNNYGIVEIQSGTLFWYSVLNNGAVTIFAGATNRIGSTSSGNGTFTAQAPALVEWLGPYSLNPGAQLNGTGLYKVSGSGSLTANTDVSPQNLDLAATLGGTGIVTVNHAMNWTSGVMTGSGRTRIAAGATLNISNASAVNLTTRTLENAGTTTFTGTADFSGSGGVITNRLGALFEVRNNASFSHTLFGCRFDNAGTFRKRIATGTNTFSSAFVFNNYGTVDLRSGILAANGGYTSTSGALLNCALGGTNVGTGYGQLRKSGTITLGGGLSVDLLPGFTPETNDTFTVVTAGTRSGTFSGFTYPANRVTMQMSNTPTSVLLTTAEVFPVPQPVLSTPEIVGSNALLTWTATSNVTYRLEHKPDAGAASWTEIPDDVTTLSNTASKLDPLTTSNRLYRVHVFP